MYDDCEESYMNLACEILRQNKSLMQEILRAGIVHDIICDLYGTEGPADGEPLFPAMMSILNENTVSIDSDDDSLEELIDTASGRGRMDGINEAAEAVAKVVKKLADEGRLNEVPKYLSSREAILRSCIDLCV